MKKRQYSTKEYLTRAFHREKRKTIAKCEELGLMWYEVSKDDEELREYPNLYVCIQSPNEMCIGEHFNDEIPPESIFVDKNDYEMFFIL